MLPLLQIIGGIGSIGTLVCFILVLIKMFQDGKTGLGIACILLACLCGIGGIIAFVVGWQNADRWNIRSVMQAWTGCIIVWLVCGVLVAVMGGIQLPAGGLNPQVR